MPRCDLCFKEKSPLQKVLPKMQAEVCKGCFYDIDRIIGFLAHYGGSILVQGEMALEAPKRKSKGKKKVAPPIPSTPTS